MNTFFELLLTFTEVFILAFRLLSCNQAKRCRDSILPRFIYSILLILIVAYCTEANPAGGYIVDTSPLPPQRGLVNKLLSEK